MDKLRVSFQASRTAHSGQYSPANVGAAWIEDANEQYVRTVELWAGERTTSITMWDLRNCASDPTLADAVSSATLPEHVAHAPVWDTRDFEGRVVPDGEYYLWLQVSENEIVPEGPYTQIAFSKRTTAWTLIPEPAPGFSEIELGYTPQSD